MFSSHPVLLRNQGRTCYYSATSYCYHYHYYYSCCYWCTIWGGKAVIPQTDKLKTKLYSALSSPPPFATICNRDLFLKHLKRAYCVQSTVQTQGSNPRAQRKGSVGVSRVQIVGHHGDWGVGAALQRSLELLFKSWRKEHVWTNALCERCKAKRVAGRAWAKMWSGYIFDILGESD